MGPTFWTVFKADLAFSLCSITLATILTIIIAKYRKRKLKQAALSVKKIEGPRVVVVGGKEPNPAHCPLCGRDWPLPGPDGENKI